MASPRLFPLITLEMKNIPNLKKTKSDVDVALSVRVGGIAMLP